MIRALAPLATDEGNIWLLSKALSSSKVLDWKKSSLAHHHKKSRPKMKRPETMRNRKKNLQFCLVVPKPTLKFYMYEWRY